MINQAVLMYIMLSLVAGLAFSLLIYILIRRRNPPSAFEDSGRSHSSRSLRGEKKGETVDTSTDSLIITPPPLPRQEAPAWDGSSSLDGFNLEAEIEKLKARKLLEKQGKQAGQSDTTALRASMPNFVPFEDTQQNNIPPDPSHQNSQPNFQQNLQPSLDIPDQLFHQETIPQEGVLALPYMIIKSEGVAGAVLFDRAGLPYSAVKSADDFDKYKIAAYSAESIRYLKQLGAKDSPQTPDGHPAKITWLTAWIDKKNVVIIEKESLICGIVLENNMNITNIVEMATRVISQFGRYTPKEYR